MAQPPISMLCGDEVPAIVVDMGSSSSKFGSGGHDQPRHVFQSQVGIRDYGSGGNSAMETETSSSQYILGDVALRAVQDGIGIENVYSVDRNNNDKINWDQVEALFRYGIEGCMRLKTDDYPLLLAESFFTGDNRTKLLELCYESMNAPATYIAKNSVLASFGAGRPTSLVVDFGSSGTRITPVVDGFALENAIVETQRGGDWLDAQLLIAIKGAGYTVKPWFLTDACPSLSKGRKPHQSFIDTHVNNVIRDAKTWMCFVPRENIADEAKEDFVTRLKMPPYELPDGTKVAITKDMCFLPETFIKGSSAAAYGAEVSEKIPLPSGFLPPHIQDSKVDRENDSLQMLIMDSLRKTDVDVRRNLLSNMLMVGGASVTDGLQLRLTNELGKLLPPNMKPKVVQQLPIEKQKASWIGGSILSVCGSFQQLWLSKAEYDEYGQSAIASRFNK